LGKILRDRYCSLPVFHEFMMFTLSGCGSLGDRYMMALLGVGEKKWTTPYESDNKADPQHQKKNQKHTTAGIR
jgi:hypothetical protein